MQTIDELRPAQPPSRLLILASLVAFGLLYLILHRADFGATWMEDLPIYKKAIHAFLSGENPYEQNHFGLHFVYPPVVLYPVSWIVRFMPGDGAWLLFSAVHIACVLAAPFVLARFYFRLHWLTPALAFLVWFAETDFTGISALFSANVAPTLYLAALLALVPGLRKNRWGWFYAIVAIAAAIKVTFLVLLLFPVLAGIQQWLRSCLVAGMVAAAYAAQRLTMPVLYAGYKRALVQQIAVQNLYGYGVFGTAAALEQKLHTSLLGSYAAQALFAAALFGCLLWLRWRMNLVPASATGAVWRERENIWLGLLLMSAIVINPRVLHYDMYLALFAAFVTLALIFHVTGWRIIALLTGLYLPCRIVLPHVRPLLLSRTYSLLVVLVAICAALWHLRRTAAPPAALQEPVESNARV